MKTRGNESTFSKNERKCAATLCTYGLQISIRFKFVPLCKVCSRVQICTTHGFSWSTFRIFEIIVLFFIVGIFDLVHDVEATYRLCF